KSGLPREPLSVSNTPPESKVAYGVSHFSQSANIQQKISSTQNSFGYGQPLSPKTRPSAPNIVWTCSADLIILGNKTTYPDVK
ncbi:MAG: hypothetical protein WBJ05_00540, partial [Bacillota bacterium]